MPKKQSVKREIAARDLFDCHDFGAFVSSIVQVLPFKGASMSRFYMCQLNDVPFLTKLSFYKKTPPEIYGAVSSHRLAPADAEISILHTLSREIVGANYTPCILELIYSKICTSIGTSIPSKHFCEEVTSGNPSDASHDVHSIMCKYHDMVEAGLAHDKCAFLVLDRCDMTLDEFLRRGAHTSVNIAVFKSILFQIVHAVYVLRTIYPGFRHYDLHTDNVMLKFDTSYVFSANSPQFLVFFVGGVAHSVPYFGIIAKIIDFGFSTLPERNISSAAIDDKMQMYFRTDNDLVVMFFWIYQAVTSSSGALVDRVEELLQRLEPNQSYTTYNPAYLRSISKKIPSPIEMAHNSVWAEYRRFRPKPQQVYAKYAKVPTGATNGTRRRS